MELGTWNLELGISMRKRQLGNSDLHVTPIGFGAWAIGGGGWAFAWGAQDDTDSIAAIRINARIWNAPLVPLTVSPDTSGPGSRPVIGPASVLAHWDVDEPLALPGSAGCCSIIIDIIWLQRSIIWFI